MLLLLLAHKEIVRLVYIVRRRVVLMVRLLLCGVVVI